VTTFIEKYEKGSQTGVLDLFYYLQEYFVQKLFPTHSHDSYDGRDFSPESPQLVEFIHEKRRALEMLRYLIIEVYRLLATRLTGDSLSKLTRVSFPALISPFRFEVDEVTGQRPE
jgi:hypothetical protein